MTPFEFVAVFFSVMLGLGVTRFLGSLSDLIEVRGRVRLSWTHGVWATAVLLLLIHSWWGMWSLREVEAWPYAGFLTIVAYLGALYVLSTLVFPTIQEAGDVDLWEHYMFVRPMFLTTFTIVFVMAGLVNHTMFAAPLNSVFVVVPLVGAAAGLAGVVSSNRIYDTCLALGFLAGILAIMVNDQTVLR